MSVMPTTYDFVKDKVCQTHQTCSPIKWRHGVDLDPRLPVLRIYCEVRNKCPQRELRVALLAHFMTKLLSWEFGAFWHALSHELRKISEWSLLVWLVPVTRGQAHVRVHIFRIILACNVQAFDSMTGHVSFETPVVMAWFVFHTALMVSKEISSKV